MKQLYILLLIACSIPLAAQNILDIKKRDFKQETGDFGFAWDQIKEGNFFLEEGSMEGAQRAISFYLKAAEYNSDCAPLNYNIAQAYILTKNYEDAVVFLQRTYDTNPWLTEQLLFELAKAQHMNARFSDARKSYESFLAAAELELVQEITPLINKRIQECNNGTELFKKPVRAYVKNLGKNINTSYAEHSPIISANNKFLYFTSRRPSADNDKRDKDGGYFEDIYVAEYKNGAWQAAKTVGEPLNTSRHDATIGLSADGQKMYVYRSSGNGDIYESDLVGANWSKAHELEGEVNSSDRESSACISFDGKKLYFVTDAEYASAQGGTDIYVSNLQADGSWGKPSNLGANINTKYNEEQVFLMPDGRTMYFSSQGHNSMGGFDIFVSTLQENGRWSKPKNIGPPMNTPGDDVFYSSAASGKFAYYSSVAQGGLGSSDIYKITYLSPINTLDMESEDPLIASQTEPIKETEVVKQMEIKTIRLTIVKGSIVDAVSKQPVEANIEIVDNEENKVVFVTRSNSATGSYLLSLPSGKNYGIAVHQKGYMFHSENFDIPPAQDYTEIDKDIEMLSIKVGSKVVLKNIFFDFGKTTLRSTSDPEIERIAEFMKRYTTVKIKINGHTDNVGDNAGNKYISQKRAEAVVQALVAKGVNITRIKAEGYGESKPIADNKTEEGRQQNRRVEFEILQQ